MNNKQQIVFNKIKLKNFMKYGNKETFFNIEKGLHLMVGANGNGKSSIWEALYYGLYGRTYNGRTLGTLVNNINKSDMLVEIEFSINDNNYRVLRGQLPSKFEIYKNDELLPQLGKNDLYQKMLIEEILKVPEQAFKNLIYLEGGLLSQSFIQLSKKDKEELFSILSDTEILLTLQANLKVEKKEKTTLHTNQKYVFEMLKSNFNNDKENYEKTLKDYNDFINSLSEDDKQKQDRINQIDEILNSDEINNEKENIKNIIEKLKEFGEEPKYPEKDKITLLESNLKQKQYFKVCEGCEKLKTFLKSDIINSNDEELEKAKKEYELSKDRYEQYVSLKNEYTFKTNTLKEKIEKLKYEKTFLENSLNEKQKMKNVPKPDDTSLKNLYSKLKEEKEKLDKLTQELEDISLLEKILVSDGLKDLLLSSQLPFVNLKINEFMQKFSNYDFQFSLNNNLKEQITKAGKSFDYKSMSNGESLKLTLSIMFAFLSSVREKFGVSCNLIVLDEVLDSSLDYNARKELLDILRNVFYEDSIYIISHNSEIKQEFDSQIIIGVSDDKKFSKIEVF